MTVKQAIKSVTDLGIEYIVARQILCYVLKVNEQHIIINSEEEIEAKDFEKFEKCIYKLNNGTPLQYITNKQEFMENEFYVNEDVLIPQPDTEVLVEQAILKIKEMLKIKNKIKVLDLCTGSGAIGISLKKYFSKDIEMYASDISEKALEVAKKNASIIINVQQIHFIQSNMFENINQKFDIIVSNPPYIKTNVINTLSEEVKKEPVIALDGGEDGLKFYKIIQDNLKNYLNDDGYVLLEIGYDQKDEVIGILKNAICIKDFAGNDRVVIYKQKGINQS